MGRHKVQGMSEGLGHEAKTERKLNIRRKEQRSGEVAK